MGFFLLLGHYWVSESTAKPEPYARTPVLQTRAAQLRFMESGDERAFYRGLLVETCVLTPGPAGQLDTSRCLPGLAMRQCMTAAPWGIKRQSEMQGCLQEASRVRTRNRKNWLVVQFQTEDLR